LAGYKKDPCIKNEKKRIITMPQILIIGGSDAGMSAALRIRELSPLTKVTVMLADNYPNFSICGLPFYLSGEVADWRDLAHRKIQDISGKGIHLLTQHRAIALDPHQKLVTALSPNNHAVEIPYDHLILGTGAVSRRPPIKGLELPGVFFLRWMGDGIRLREYMEEQKPSSAIIIGGGYIGLEMADALTRRGIQVTLAQHSPAVLKNVHPSFGMLIEDELKSHALRVETGISVKKIQQSSNGMQVTGAPDFSATADFVLVAVGVRPATELAETAGITLGAEGAIQVNQRMETNVPGIYAAGDCVQSWHQLLQKSVYLPLGTTAHKQGRIAGENAGGGRREFEGTLGTQVVKVFDLAIARTGLQDEEARQAGYEPQSIAFETWDHKVYYKGAHPLRILLTGDIHTKALLGAQLIGHYQSEVAKRVDIIATAIFHRMTVDQLNDLDLSYTPPLSSPWDPLQSAAQAWVKACY
jgi:NADPH-dependent 2,4-dienoyl-CoA reductase/sulfur reductase-like enzyme